MKNYPLLLKFIRLLTRIYFRAEVEGINNIPSGRCLFVSNHNLGMGWNPEIWIFGSNYYLSDKYDLPLYGVAHQLGFKVPIFSSILKFGGAFPGYYKESSEMLRHQNKLILYPGGGWEAFRPSKERDKIDFKERVGFVRLAKEAGVKIVPVVLAGGHDGFYIWKRGNRIARFFKLDKYFNIDIFPIGFALPFGFIFSIFTPFIPLPRKAKMSILEPIETSADVEYIANEVKVKMQKELTRLVSELPRSIK